MSVLRGSEKTMSNSWHIGRAFGINVHVHWTMLLLALWILLSNPGTAALFALALTGALFGCVVLHELGHALAARHFGIRTRDITLYPIGGVARLESTGNRPWEEFCIALAGPAVNVVIALGLGALWLLMIAANPIIAAETTLGHFVYWLMVLNIGMVVFNLLPAFPMDGGRVLRAVLSGALGQVRATRIAAGLGMALAVVLGVVGIAYFQNPWLALIAGFVVIAGQQELQAVEMRERLRAAAWSPYGDSRPSDWEHWTAPYGQRPAHAEAPAEEPALRPKVTVYVWDAPHQVWVKQ
jgi:Zn-dependent protease